MLIRVGRNRAAFAFCVALGAALLPAAARAFQYEIFIDIETEEDLYDLRTENLIGDDTFDALLELLQRGVDLNRANREELYTLPNLTYPEVDKILKYRAAVGYIESLGDLVANEVLSAEKLDSIVVFLIVSEPGVRRTRTTAELRAQTRLTPRMVSNYPSGEQDRLPPPSAVSLRLRTLENLHIGLVGILERNRVGRPSFDRGRSALTVRGESTRFVAPKAYAHWNDETWTVIAGTYRIGFGQRLTFDKTNQATPNGIYVDHEFRRETDLTVLCREVAGELPESPCSGPVGAVRITPDFGWTNRLTGVAGGAKELALGVGWLQMYAWASYQIHKLQQSEIYDRSVCDDPRDPTCRAPDVFRTRGDLTEPTSRYIQTTLPLLYAEALGGGNLTYHINARARVGVTGYGSTINWMVDEIDLDFQEFARTPFGGPFGAIGIDASYGFGPQDFFVEVARSFDNQPGDGGGYAGIFRSVTGFATTEIEATLRYYDDNYNNPNARPISQADEFEGLRARDEVGLRIRTTSRLRSKYDFRTDFDIWRDTMGKVYAPHKVRFSARGDLQFTRKWRWSLWGEYENKNLRNNGRSQCFSGTRSINGIQVDCDGQQIFVATGFRYEPSQMGSLSLQYQHEWVDVLRFDNQFQQDAALIVAGLIRPTSRLRIRARVRYDNENIRENRFGEHVVWSYIDAMYQITNVHMLRGRYDFRIFVDDRAFTKVREPNPEHSLLLEYVARIR